VVDSRLPASSFATWHRPPARAPRAYKANRRVHSIFYGYPPELIAQWCAVSPGTAARWKAGTTKPTRQALKLFGLFANELVLTPDFRRFRIRKNALVDPQGQKLSVSQLEQYQVLLQFTAEVAQRSRDSADVDRYYALLQQVS
jgi:hypothetical protein